MLIKGKLDIDPLTTRAKFSISVMSAKNPSTLLRDSIGSHTVSKLSKINKQDLLSDKYWTTGFVRSFTGFNPMWDPINAASSMLVVAESQGTKKKMLVFGHDVWVVESGFG
jgi:hypothetical protein